MGHLAEAYRRHFGGTESPIQLYGGFTAFFAGFAMGLIGILIVLSGDLLIPDETQRNFIGILIAALGAPFLFMGLQLTLPSRLGIHTLAGAGALVCLYGVYRFTRVWPGLWETQFDRVIAVYTLGLVFLFTTTALALIVNFISRHTTLPGRELEDDIFVDPDRSVSMDEVMRDIEREVARQRLTWGGMEDDRLPREFLKLRADFGPGATVSKGRAGKVTETMANEMDLAFTSLARLRGVEGREVAGEDDTSTAIDALKALRRARQAELERSWWYRFKRWLVSLFTGKPKSQDQDEDPPKIEIERESRNKATGPAQEAVDAGRKEEEKGSGSRGKRGIETEQRG